MASSGDSVARQLTTGKRPRRHGSTSRTSVDVTLRRRRAAAARRRAQQAHQADVIGNTRRRKQEDKKKGRWPFLM